MERGGGHGRRIEIGVGIGIQIGGIGIEIGIRLRRCSKGEVPTAHYPSHQESSPTEGKSADFVEPSEFRATIRWSL